MRFGAYRRTAHRRSDETGLAAAWVRGRSLNPKSESDSFASFLRYYFSGVRSANSSSDPSLFTVKAGGVICFQLTRLRLSHCLASQRRLC